MERIITESSHSRIFEKVWVVRWALKEPLMIPRVIDPKVEEVAHLNPIRAMLGEMYKVYPATMDANAYWKLMPEATTYTLKAFATKLKEGIKRDLAKQTVFWVQSLIL